jgi:hypothetical protein
VSRLDIFGGVKVGNGARDLEDAVVRSCRKSSLVMALSNSFSPSAEIAQNLRISLGILWAFE